MTSSGAYDKKPGEMFIVLFYRGTDSAFYTFSF